MKRLISLLLSVVLLVGLVTVGAVPVSAESAFEPSDDMIALLKILEGFDRYPRWDYTQWTVGYGTACPAEDLERLKAEGITVEEAESLLVKHLSGFVKSVNSFNDKYELNMTQNQFDAILLFTYNMGHAWMFRDGTFRSALINGAEGNDLLYAIGQWCHAGGNVLTQLIKRRLMEYNMFINGVYSRTVPDNLCYVIYEMNGGTGATDVQCYDSDLTDGIRVIPTREGYVFDGWYTSNTGGTKVTVLDASVRNMTLYARWILEEEMPSEPKTEPTEPETQPTEPETQPTEPETQPTEPETEPTEPETEPTEPEAKPTEPEETTPVVQGVTVTVTADNVNIRKGPGTNYGVTNCVKKGAQMTITEVQTGSGYTWGKFDGGWIALMYTDYEEKTTEPEETVPPVTEPEPSEPENTSVMGTVTGSDLRIREGAGTSYKTVGFFQKGDRVEILEQTTVGSMNWGRTEKGWISLTYVKLDETVKEPVPEETTPEQTEPEETQPNQPETTTVTGTVTATELRVRENAGTSYKTLSVLKKGAKVEIYETKTVNGMTWGRISDGWISLSYVNLDQTSTQTVTMTVNTSCLRIRSGAGTSNSVVGFLYQGAKVEVLETKSVNGTTWARLEKGWVSMDYLK